MSGVRGKPFSSVGHWPRKQLLKILVLGEPLLPGFFVPWGALFYPCVDEREKHQLGRVWLNPGRPALRRFGVSERLPCQCLGFHGFHASGGPQLCMCPCFTWLGGDLLHPLPCLSVSLPSLSPPPWPSLFCFLW